MGYSPCGSKESDTTEVTEHTRHKWRKLTQSNEDPVQLKMINLKKKGSSNMKSEKMLCQPQSPVKLMIGYLWGHASQGPKQASHWLSESLCVFLSW